jgi:hypothetical protein
MVKFVPFRTRPEAPAANSRFSVCGSNNIMWDLIYSPFPVLILPFLVSLLSRDIMLIVSVAAVSLAGALAAMGIPSGREQWLVIGLMSLAGFSFALFGILTRRALRSAERLKEQLSDLRLATSSLRNALEYERERGRERVPQILEEEEQHP